MPGDAEYIEFFKCFPLLPPQTLMPLQADGFIEIPDGPRVPITIDVEAAGGKYCVGAIMSTTEIERYLSDRRQELDVRFSQCTSALPFVRELLHSLEAMPAAPSRQASKFYAQVVRECNELVGWDCVESFDEKSQIMSLDLGYKVYADFGNEVFSSDLEDRTTAMDIGLPGYLDKLRGVCLQMSESWRMLDDIDRSLCVLQPQHPRRSDLWRRVAVSGLTSALVKVSPDRHYPKVVVYGPASVSGPLNQRVKELRVQWNSLHSVRENLEDILDFKLPEPSTFDQQDDKIKCGICLAFRDGDDTADQVCTSDRCGQSFHRQCLIQVRSEAHSIGQVLYRIQCLAATNMCVDVCVVADDQRGHSTELQHVLWQVSVLQRSK
ncbi:hypothetical protein GGI20_003698 [Coemansia sp. BCRC 34301]|nr:hypothetical protein GGI20_003698 [Coemansia sp. BCRC 34301]